MILTEIIALCTSLVLIAGGAAAVWKIFRFLDRMGDVMDDWFVEPGRPGVKARPGVMERLEAIEHELHPNSGASLRDAVDHVAGTVERLEELFDEHLESVSNNNHQE